jgi:hypothetical protein
MFSLIRWHSLELIENPLLFSHEVLATCRLNHGASILFNNPKEKKKENLKNGLWDIPPHPPFSFF